MKTFILLLVASIAVVSQAGPQTETTVRQVISISRTEHDSRRNEAAWRQEGVEYLNSLSTRPLESSGQEERLAVLTWLVQTAKPGTPDLSPMLTNLLQHEATETVRGATIKAMGDLGNPSLVPQLKAQLFPPMPSNFLVYTSVREEAARSLGKLTQKFPKEIEIASTLEVLEKAVADRSLLTGAVDGIALCGVERESVQKLLGKVLLNENQAYSELSRIRVVQWYRNSAMTEQKLSDLRAASTSRQTRVALSAIHTLLVTRNASPGTAAALRQIILLHRHVEPELANYAKNLQRQGGLAEELPSLGPSIQDVCRLVLRGS